MSRAKFEQLSTNPTLPLKRAGFAADHRQIESTRSMSPGSVSMAMARGGRPSTTRHKPLLGVDVCWQLWRRQKAADLPVLSVQQEKLFDRGGTRFLVKERVWVEPLFFSASRLRTVGQWSDLF